MKGGEEDCYLAQGEVRGQERKGGRRPLLRQTSKEGLPLCQGEKKKTTCLRGRRPSPWGAEGVKGRSSFPYGRQAGEGENRRTATLLLSTKEKGGRSPTTQEGGVLLCYGKKEREGLRGNLAYIIEGLREGGRLPQSNRKEKKKKLLTKKETRKKKKIAPPKDSVRKRPFFLLQWEGRIWGVRGEPFKGGALLSFPTHDGGGVLSYLQRGKRKKRTVLQKRLLLDRKKERGLIVGRKEKASLFTLSGGKKNYPFAA